MSNAQQRNLGRVQQAFLWQMFRPIGHWAKEKNNRDSSTIILRYSDPTTKLLFELNDSLLKAMLQNWSERKQKHYGLINSALETATSVGQYLKIIDVFGNKLSLISTKISPMDRSQKTIHIDQWELWMAPKTESEITDKEQQKIKLISAFDV